MLSLLLLLACTEGVITLKDGDDDSGIGCATGMGDDCDGDGYATSDGDCNDYASSVNPGVAEDCGNGADDDCDGSTDAADGACSATDDDGDGYLSDVDCDDADASVNSGATETWYDGIDQDCDGASDYDMDGDGYDAADYGGDDCDDSDTGIRPDAIEACDDVDNDCDGSTDETGALGGDTWYADADGDGYGDAWATTDACDQPPGYVADDTDCADGDAGINPAAAEVCNDGVDNDCDASTDDTTGDTWYADADGDGYGDAGVTTTSCDQPSGYVTLDTDCDDTDGSVSPAAAEVCNDVDDDCDGDIDADATDAATWYADADGDLYGDASVTAAACDQPAGYVSDDTDCDDADGTASPAGIEICDGVDNDCDGTVDDDATDASTWYADADSDGYGDSAVPAVECSAPAGYVSDDTDCDDTAAAINPAATETCDGKDDDCDGSVPSDETDDDGDGYDECSGADCDDADDTVYPTADEYCGGTDHDCDGVVNEATSEDTTRYWQDADGDGWGGTSYSDSCSAPAGYVTANGDCDDGDAAQNLDDVDSDGYDTCDGDCDDTDEDLTPNDGDGDGQSTCDGDCNDSEVSMYVGGTETCDSRDNDCDGTVDDGVTTTYYPDADRDGYGDPSGTTTESCTRPVGYATSATDCDDSLVSVNPGASETCNLVDDDCDGTADDGFDADADGAYSESECSYGTDCDDADATVSPSASEACDGSDNDCDGDVDEDFDADGDGYADASACAAGEDCDDTDATVNPEGREIEISTSLVDNCSDGADQDCDGSADASDWDCQDDDSDGIENGVDVLVAQDGDGDGDDETLCVVAYDDLAMPSPWNGWDGVLQGESWGGFSALSASSYTIPLTSYADSDGDGTDDVNAWCVDFTDATYAPSRDGTWSWRVVSTIASDGSTTAPTTCSTYSTATTWKRLDIADFCDVTADDWCRTGVASNDGCNTTLSYGIISIVWDGTATSIEPY